MRSALAAFPAVFGSVWRDERGVTLVLTALMMAALLAITGLAVDAGWWYTLHRRNQSAADAAALSAAYELLNNSGWTSTNLTPFATGAAQQNGYSGDTPDVTATSDRVEVVLHQPQSTWFAALAGLNSVTISNRAVAQIVTLDKPCMYVLNPTAPQALSIIGSATLTATGCSICDNSDADDAVYMQGGHNANIVADSLLIRGEMSETGSATPTLKHPAQFGFGQCTDPFASKLTHSYLTADMPTKPACTKTGSTWSGNCVVAGTSISPGDTLSPDTQISGGLKIKNGTVDLSPGGNYWITDGDLTLDNGSGAGLTCSTCVNGTSGVTVIMTTASGNTVGGVNLASNANLNLTAPSSGPFAGMVLIQDSNDLPKNTKFNPVSVQANAAETLSGLVYFPQSAMDFQGTPVANGPQCLLIVANTMTLHGNPAMVTTGCAQLNMTPPPIQTVTLVE